MTSQVPGVVLLSRSQSFSPIIVAQECCLICCTEEATVLLLQNTVGVQGIAREAGKVCGSWLVRRSGCSSRFL